MNAIRRLWRNPWARLFVVAWALLLLAGFILADEGREPIHDWHLSRGPLVNWWYFILPPAVALAIRLVMGGFLTKYLGEPNPQPAADEPKPQPPVAAAATGVSDAGGAQTSRRPRRLLRWTLAGVVLMVWSAFVLGIGTDTYEKQMNATRCKPGSLSYAYGTTGYNFGWYDGFMRGYALGAARVQSEAKAGRTGPLNDYAEVIDRETSPEWCSALVAHEAGLLVVRGGTTGQDAAFAKPASEPGR